MTQAAMARSSFNLVHLATLFKVDVFVYSREPWQESELARGKVQRVGSGAEAMALRFASAEDTLLHKLVWYRLGGETSDRQWGDVTGIAKVQAATLDREYLRRWAPELGVSDLLAKLLVDEGF